MISGDGKAPGRCSTPLPPQGQTTRIPLLRQKPDASSVSMVIFARVSRTDCHASDLAASLTEVIQELIAYDASVLSGKA